jgi:hypothetical protein
MCGGFFGPTPEEILYQSAQQVILTVNEDDTYTAILNIQYEGKAEEFSWLLPMPSEPIVDVVDNSLFNDLYATTHPQLIEPVNPCRGVLTVVGFGGGSPIGVAMGYVGPYEYAYLQADDPVTWLRENGYYVAPEHEPIIASYVEMGMGFLAMKLRQDAEVGEIQPIKLTYTADELMLPLRISSVSAVEKLPVFVWIFADTPYAPANYANPVPDYSVLRHSSELNYAGSGEVSRLYPQIIDQFQAEFDGLMFVTEYVQPTHVLDSAFLTDGLDQFAYVTRLHAQLSPSQMILDPVFVPAPDQAPVNQRIVLADYVDPLHFWGCSTRSIAVDHADLTNLYEVTMEYDEYYRLTITAALPEGWEAYNLTFEGRDLFVFAPEPVDEDTLNAFREGQDTPPMFVLIPVSIYKGDDGEVTGRSIAYQLMGDRFEFEEMSRRVDFAATLPSYYGNEGWSMALLTSSEDWQANQALYRAMYDYLKSYPDYVGHDLLPYALLLGDVFSMYEIPFEGGLPLISLGQPEGWTEYTVSETEWLIVPDDGADARARLRLLRQFDPDYRVGNAPSMVIERIGQEYGIADPEAAFEAYFGCDIPAVSVPFEHDGRSGFLRFSNGYLLETSATDELFDDYKDILIAIDESLMRADAPCG